MSDLGRRAVYDEAVWGCMVDVFCALAWLLSTRSTVWANYTPAERRQSLRGLVVLGLFSFLLPLLCIEVIGAVYWCGDA
jgi:hypothetical protein